MHDLIEQKVLKQNEDGTLAEKETIQGIDQSKAFVRFIVRSLSNPLTETVDECWKDKTLWEKYQQYQRSMEGEKGLCYLSGKRESISYLQPKKIRNEGDGAKLISSMIRIILRIVVDLQRKKRHLQLEMKHPRRFTTH